MYNKVCNNAQSFAREVGVDRTTVVNWIKKGRIKAAKHKKGDWWYIGESQFKEENINRLKKPYPKYSIPYSEAEIFIIKNAQPKDINIVAKRLGRTPNAIRIKLHRMRKSSASKQK